MIRNLLKIVLFFLDIKKSFGGGGMMGMFMILGGGGGKFNIVVVRFSSGVSDRNILNSWNRSYDDSEYFIMY